MTTHINTHNPVWFPDREAGCPTCQERTRFSFRGEQRWPLRVAQALGIEPVVRLWNCHNCNTTVSEDALE
jgi:hypothetical protein